MIYKNPCEFVEKKKYKSKWEEYRWGEWRKGAGKTFVTIDTEIPTLPEKHITAPDETAFHKKQVEIETKIKEIIKSLEERKSTFSDLLSQKQAHRKGNPGQFNSTEVKDKISRLKQLNKQNNVIKGEQDSVNDDIGKIVKERELLNKKIHRTWNTVELVPKGLKEIRKKLETGSGNFKVEGVLIKDIDFLKASLQYIEQKDVLNEKLNAIYKTKKEATKELPALIKEKKALQAEVDELRKNKEVTETNIDELDRELDKLTEKRKKDSDEIDKLKKQKEELRNDYYSSMIEFTKFQYLVQDVKWMGEKKAEIVERETAYQARKAEREERQRKIQAERDERKQKDVERKEREEARKIKEVENKK